MTDLPTGWEWAKLGDLVECLDHRRIPVSAKERAKRPGATPYYGAAGQVDTIDGVLFDEPLILLGEDGVQFFDRDKPKAYLIDGPAWVNNHAHVLRTNPDVIDRRFLAYYLNWVDYHGHANGTTRLKLTQAAMRELPVRLPGLADQLQVAEALESLLSRFGAGMTVLTKIIARARALRQQVLDSLASEHASGWTTLGSMVARVEAGRSFGKAAGPAREDEWGIVKVSAMTWGEFRATENKAVPADRVDPRYEIHEGDVLVSRANTSEYVGAPVLVGPVRPRLLLSDKSLRLVPKTSVDPRWLVTVLGSPSARRQITDRATGTKESMRNISQAGLLAIQVPDAGPGEQAALLERWLQWEMMIDRLNQAVTGAEQRAVHLRRALLTAAFTGELSGRSSEDAVAELVGAG